MKVKNLIKELEKQNPESEVVSYIDQSEEYGEVEKIEVANNDYDLRYTKTGFYSAQPTEELPLVVLYGNTCLEREDVETEERI